MFVQNESLSSSQPHAKLIEQAIRTLQQSVATHIEYESRLQKLCANWQENWLAQCDQLRSRMDLLETRLSPWMTERQDGPRLSLVSHRDDAA